MGLMDSLRALFGAHSDQVRDARPPAVIAAGAREAAFVALETGNWRGASVAANKLISDGGEATTPEPWLLYAASAVLNERPVNAISSIDVGLRNWVHGAQDRAIMHWARATVTQHQLKDPKTALLDFDAAKADCPVWLVEQLAVERKRCASKARARRTLAPEIAAPPDYDPLADRDRAAAPLTGLVDGTQPSVWSAVLAVLQKPVEGERGPKAWDEYDEDEDESYDESAVPE